MEDIREITIKFHKRENRVSLATSDFVYLLNKCFEQDEIEDIVDNDEEDDGGQSE